ncbi:hypothetical protein DFH28DRAFT_1080132 [Melampsora americana]|nr:hypothetical protein DFH28DRAFT_1087985 [Melampsora americana]KAH9819488.1 hypothetical protein DFH28DRAFT_1080132 [Melampsora americana]
MTASKPTVSGSTTTHRRKRTTKSSGSTPLASKKVRLTVPQSNSSDSDYPDHQDETDGSDSAAELRMHQDDPEDEDEANWDDEPPPTLSGTSHPTQPAKPQKFTITLENYNDVDLDIPTINSLLSASGRQTRNRIPPPVQKELKNLQFMYRRAKKLLSLVAHCSERTINEFLQCSDETVILPVILKV